MSSCLGLYIENNIIKYAKVSKERDNFKVESFGMKFYDNIDETVKQIVNETYSYKTPISTNLSDEKYTCSELFSLLNAKDLNRAVKTEFDYFCDENRKNNNALEYRNLLIPNPDNKDKIISLYAYTEKSDIARKSQILSGFRINNISPLPISISNLMQNIDKNNKVIVNIEKSTSVTFIVDGKVSKVEVIEIGMKDILDNIMMKENSYAKAYEICKNTTIYTSQGRNLQVEENEYIEDIMPTLYKIVEEVKRVITESRINVSDIYITGLASAINNIDLYFQENFMDKKCEILAPFFVQKSNLKLNIRDYIEVNSAIALALQGLNVGYKEINFKNKGTLDQFKDLMNVEIGSPSNKKKNNINSKGNISEKMQEMFKSGFNKSLDSVETNMIRVAVGLLILFIAYVVLSGQIMRRIDKKHNEVQSYISDSREQIASITGNIRLVEEREEQYNSMIEKINEANDKLTQSYAKKNVLPNFLTEIMFNIPKEVQLSSIENTSGKKVTIQAKSKEYEQLGYFIAKIKNEGILTDVTSTAGNRQDEFIVVTIEGNLPY